MKTISILGVVVGLLVSALPAAAVGAPVADLTALARYAPANAPIYAAIRTDDGFIEKLDALLARINAKIPDALPPDLSLATALDEADIRPWLGDVAAIIIPTPQAFMAAASGRSDQFIMAVSLADRQAAEMFVSTALHGDFNTVQEQSGVTVYVPDPRYDDPVFAVYDDALLIGEHRQTLAELPKESLAGNTTFAATVELLPADDYDALVYLSVKNLLAPMRTLMQQSAAPGMEMFLDVVGAQVYGFALWDGRSLVMDVAQTLGDTAALQAAGLWVAPNLKPVDPGFAAHVPADVPLVIQGTDLGAATRMQFEMLRAFGDFVQKNPTLFAGPEASEEALQAFASFNLGYLVTAANLGFAGLTGLNLEKDVLDWMQGDWALFARVLPDDALGFTLDVGFVTETANAGKTESALIALGDALEAYDLSHEYEVVGEAGVLVAPSLIRAFFPPKTPIDLLYHTDQLDVLFGANADVFAMGTRSAATFSLAPTGGGLAETPAFRYARTLLLDGANSFGYLAVAPLRAYLDDLSASTGGEGASLSATQRILSLFESGSFSAVSTEGGDSIGRFVLTLAP